MTYRESDIQFETKKHFVLESPHGGFDVYSIGVTHSTRCARIGFKGAEGLARALAEINRREEPAGDFSDLV